VRRLAGVIAESGRGRLAPDAVGDLLANDSSLPARVAAPASGLFLEKVFYEAPPSSWPIEPAVLRVD
jgi:tRNA U38,U39,U40 pseudouridine synthase TruA